jgi:hypothetical protein
LSHLNEIKNIKRSKSTEDIERRSRNKDKKNKREDKSNNNNNVNKNENDNKNNRLIIMNRDCRSADD